MQKYYTEIKINLISEDKPLSVYIESSFYKKLADLLPSRVNLDIEEVYQNYFEIIYLFILDHTLSSIRKIRIKDDYITKHTLEKKKYEITDKVINNFIRTLYKKDKDVFITLDKKDIDLLFKKVKITSKFSELFLKEALFKKENLAEVSSVIKELKVEETIFHHFKR